MVLGDKQLPNTPLVSKNSRSVEIRKFKRLDNYKIIKCQKKLQKQLVQRS